MTYRIEITADSLTELAGRVLALSAQLQTTVPVFVHHASAAPAKDPTPAKTAANEIVALMAAAAEPVAEDAAPEVRENPVAALDFDTEVAPHVLELVKAKGKPAAQEILSQFGVEKASLLDPVRWPELVATLKGAL
jgi:cell pole-organizing protein PopZ